MVTLKDPTGELIQRVSTGDRNAQRMLYENYYGYAKKICLSYMSNEEEAVEVLNDGFLKILTKIDSFDNQFSFTTWVRRIMINSSIDYYRKFSKNKYQIFEEISEQNEPFFEQGFDLDSIENILPILQLLSPAYRTVLLLYVVEEYSHEEISQKLGITSSTSRSNLNRALVKLRSLAESKKMSVQTAK